MAGDRYVYKFNSSLMNQSQDFVRWVERGTAAADRSQHLVDRRRDCAYSPYHNIRSGTDYPPVLVTTADNDDRVVPVTASNTLRPFRQPMSATSRTPSGSRRGQGMEAASRPTR